MALFAGEEKRNKTIWGGRGGRERDQRSVPTLHDPIVPDFRVAQQSESNPRFIYPLSRIFVHCIIYDDEHELDWSY